MTPLEQTTNNQRHAADPARSVFVMANAGSGKTRVLTNRVARLLLAGAPPQKILCITFTKAAAAEMAERLFSVLGDWALASDENLVKELAKLEGPGAAAKSADDLAQARRLFARALETPGGLKIQTIHSFCESVLRRFPIEAGAPPGFTVVEDAPATALLNGALDAVAVNAREDAALAAAFDRLSLKRNENDLRQLLIGAAAKGGVDDIGTAATELAKTLAINPDETADAVKRKFLNEISVEELRRAHDGLAAEGKQPQAAALRLSAYFSAADDAERWDALVKTFLVADQSKTVNRIASKATDKHDPWVGPYVNTLKELVFTELQAVRAHALYDDTLAFWRLTSALNERYAEAKSARAMLDFNDLIARAEALFQRHEAAWIMYKLDYGIDHILIDEAQDTSPGQWAVVENLFADYFSGAGARAALRSFFAVGDMKQSIYSFQGADVDLFKAKEFDLGEKLSAVTEYKNIPLTMSFRTTEPVLSFVDAAFNDPQAAEGLGEFPIPAHGVCREGAAGLVEIWPLTPRPEKPEINPWDAPVDAPEASHPVRLLCDRVASTIKGWLDTKEPLESRGRAIRPGDIMILVQSRGALFREIIQRLSAAGVPVAGPDRLQLADDPAVEDLISYARFVLTEGDDLSLAEILKSPLFGFDDDADLFPLAYGRGKGVTLWRSLRSRADEKEKWKQAVEEIVTARGLARAQGPYAFFSHVLETGAMSGRKRFFERLGEASSDAMDELLRQALDFENGNPRSLREFVAWFDGASGDIKREMERENQSVRVMTVHGAKGLEADIVFLLDAHREANTRNIGPLLDPPPGAGLPDGAALLAWSKAEDAPLSAEAREEKTALAYQEYRRLFYVAATRARDRLFICGIEQGNRKNPQDKETGLKSWHSLAHDGFARLLERVETGETPFWEGGEAPLLRLSCQQTADVKTDDALRSKADAEAPSWLKQEAPKEPAPLRLTPSKLDGEEESEWRGDVEGAAYSPVAGGDRYFRGRTLHRLLELLPDVTPEKRAAAADRLLTRLAPEIAAEERAGWRDEVLHVLQDSQFAEVFAPGSMAETSIVGCPKGLADNARLNGQIDRLAVSDTRVLVVDYKTNRPPPKRVEDADPAYVAQLAAYRALLQEIYPEHEIVCALLWTYDARLMAVPSEMLDHAFARLRLT
ncbi:double-strand break repair helicase AddA [Hyphococcus sp.]|uniref:double-strand break repair helicase AddA n=1 Tax=Hyphococcus sp. TaxID=2038636 RepID=UPI0035C6803C